MKFTKFLILLVVLALPLVFVSAQEDTEDVVWSGSYVLTAESGSFVEADDDSFTLILADVSPFAPWVINLPDFASGILTTQDLIAFWTFQPELIATALVTTENESVAVTLALADDMAYNAEENTLTFVATVTSVVPFDTDIDPDKAEAPEEFEVATVFINMDVAFAEAIAAGAEARATGTRDGSTTTCTPRPGKTCP